MATNNNEFFDALAALEKERGLPADYLIDKIKAAIVIAVKKDYEVEDDNVVVDIDPNIGAFRASLLQDIVEEVENPHTQVSLEDAQKIRKTYKVGQRLVTPLKTKEFGRIAAQTAKHGFKNKYTAYCFGLSLLSIVRRTYRMSEIGRAHV